MSNPSYRPSDAVCRFYLNNSKASAGTVLELKAPRCNVELCSYDLSPQNGSATITLYLGNGINLDGTSLTNIPGPVLENLYGTSPAQTQQFIQQLRGCLVKIYCPSAAAPQSTVQVGDVQTTRQNLPTSSVDTPGTDQVITFVGIVWSTSLVTGNYHYVVTLNLVDMGGWMSRQVFNYFPMKTLIPTNYTHPIYNFMMNESLPDFNEKTGSGGTMVPNKDTSIGYTSGLTLALPDYSIKVATHAFYGLDSATADGSQYRGYWSDLDIAFTVFTYINSFQSTFLTNNGITTFNFVDQTGNLQAGVNTYSARENLWKLMTLVADKQRGLMLYWTYGGTTTATTVTLNCALQSDVALGGYNPTTKWDFTYANTQAVAFYATPPVLDFVDNDSVGYVRIFTDEVNLIYTFNLLNQFYPGWNTTAAVPSVETIENGGANSIWYSRYVMWTSQLYQMNGSGILASAAFASESWTPLNTALGVKFAASSSGGTAKLDYIYTTTPGELLPFAEGIKITENIPISNLTPNLSQESFSTPVLLFNSEGSNGNEVVQDLDIRFLKGTMQLNPPKDEVLRYENTSNLQTLYATLQIEGCPPLYINLSKNAQYYNCDSSTIEIHYKFKPTIILNNTITGINDAGVALMINNNPSDIGWLRCVEGYTLQQLYNSMMSEGTFYLRLKNKIKFKLSYIDPTNYVGRYLSTIDVPCIDGAGAIKGIGDERFMTITSNTIITKQILNYKDQTTEIWTDWEGFRIK